MNDDAVASYARTFPAASAAICDLLRTDVAQIDPKRLRRWLRKARTEIWDYAGLRSR
jgi:hypothetical protein